MYLDNLCDSISDTFDKNKEEIVLINTSDVFNGKVLNHEAVPNENIKGQFKKKFAKDDILYSEIRPANKHFAFVDFDAENYVASTKLMVLRAKKDRILPKYLYFLLKSSMILKFLQGLAESRSGTFPQITFSELSTISIELPSLKEQKIIVEFLDNIERKIENSIQINHNLEELAQTILNENFFIFSHYSENELCDTDIGKIPKDWKIFKLKDLFNHIKPGTNFQPKRTEEGIPFLNVRNINSGFIDLSDVKYISIEDYKQVHKTWAPEENDILISRIGTLGLTTIISKEDLPLAVHYNFINVKSEKLPYQFVYFLFRSNNFQRKYHTIKKYSVQEYVTIDDFSDIEIALPKNLNDINSELKIFNSIFNKIQRNITEVKKLNNLRDYLLPKLMSGEIDVSEVNCDL